MDLSTSQVEVVEQRMALVKVVLVVRAVAVLLEMLKMKTFVMEKML